MFPKDEKKTTSSGLIFQDRLKATVLIAQLVERPPGYTYVFAKGVSD